jgi:fatty-acyl-CoA synthase
LPHPGPSQGHDHPGRRKVYPREIEDLLFTHPAIANVSVVGIEDQEWGEVAAAFVQLKPGHEAMAEDLTTFCRQRLAFYKAPRIWRFVDQFPQTASGKIQKFILRDQFQP